MTQIHKFLRDEDFERAVLLTRAGRACWTESECFGAQNIQPEDELMLMKEIYLTDLATGKLQFTLGWIFLINFPSRINVQKRKFLKFASVFRVMPNCADVTGCLENEIRIFTVDFNLDLK